MYLNYYFNYFFAFVLAVYCIFFDGSIQLSIISGSLFISSYLALLCSK